MSSAILQGVPATTFDTDLWIGLPERQYMRLINLGLKQGAEFVRNTVIALRDGSLVNFIYRVTGAASFATEWRRAITTTLHGLEVKALSLERIIRSKEALQRPKDLAHLFYLRDIVASRKLTRIKR